MISVDYEGRRGTIPLYTSIRLHKGCSRMLEVSRSARCSRILEISKPARCSRILEMSRPARCSHIFEMSRSAHYSHMLEMSSDKQSKMSIKYAQYVYLEILRLNLFTVIRLSTFRTI